VDRTCDHKEDLIITFTRRLLGVAIASALFITGTSTLAQQPIRIGYSLARTGSFAVATSVQQQAYDLCREQMNEAGGLKMPDGTRRPVEFVTYDDQSEPAKAAEIYEKLISSDKVNLLLAPWGTATHIGIAPVIERHKFPLIGATASSTLLRDLGVKYMVFTEVLPDAIGGELPTLLGELGMKRVAIFTLQLPFSLEAKKYLVPALEKAGIEIVFNQEYSPDIKDMTALLLSLKATSPDAIIGLSYPSDSILYMTTARELGISAPFQFLEIGPTEPFFLQKFGANLDGIVTVGHWSPGQTKWPKARPFFDAYSAKFKEPPDYLDSVSSYMSCEILQQAVAKVGLDHEKLHGEIATGTFDTINGPVKFKGIMNITTPNGYIQIQNERAQIIWPSSIATAKFVPKGPWK
jgi:branched-chain amino acid transport system substrate-binding protein